MLRLFPYNAKAFVSGATAALDGAVNVKVTHEINGAHTLSFDYPMSDGKSAELKENMLVECEGQAYRIVKLDREYGEKRIVSAECHHIYNADAVRTHIQNIPDMIGVLPSEVIRKAFKGSPFTLFTDSELKARGLRRVDYDGFLIDFFSVDKTNPYDVMQEVIRNCGKGEIYTDNYKVALVEKLGADNGLRLSLDKNLQNLKVERNCEDLITRLYPYGFEDAHIGSVNGGKQYIDSENISLYGVREGYADYSDYSEPEKIYNRALWEFDGNNAERIDIPDISISGSLIDLSKISEYGSAENIALGDTVYVSDGSSVYKERVIKIERYPFEPMQTNVSIGRVKKDLFFYLNQIGALSRKYKKVSSRSGKINALSITGNVRVAGISVNSDGEREFCGALDAPRITLSGLELTVMNGELYAGGRKILVEEVSDEA